MTSKKSSKSKLAPDAAGQDVTLKDHLSVGYKEIVRTDAGWHVRIKSRNGKIIAWTETYCSKENALKARMTLWRIITAGGQRNVDERKRDVERRGK